MSFLSKLVSDSGVGTITAWLPSSSQSEPPEGWLPCDGSPIPQGIWMGQRTPKLDGAYLMGENSLKVIGSLTQLVVEEPNLASALRANLSDVNTGFPGFCLQNRTKEESSGCDIGERYKNKVTIDMNESSNKTIVRTLRVNFIIKCW